MSIISCPSRSLMWLDTYRSLKLWISLLGITVSIVGIFSTHITQCIATPHAHTNDHASDTLTLWHAYRGQERLKLEASIAKFQSETGQTVRILHLPYQAFTNKIQVAVPRGNGPDVFIFAHDRVGDWAESELIEPLSFWITPQEYQRYFSSAMQALTYHNQVYALPLSCKTLALFYHKKWIQTPPKSVEELIQQVEEIQKKHPDVWGLAYPEIDSLYFHAPWLHAWDGHVLDHHSNKIQLAKHAMQKSMQMIADLRTKKIIPPEVNGALVSELFRSGKLAFVINGPWFKGDLKRTLTDEQKHSTSSSLSSHDTQASNHWWGVSTLPMVEATQKRLQPFLSVEAVMVSAKSHNKLAAWKLARYLASDQVAIERLMQGQIVAQKAAYQSSQAQNDTWIQTFNQQLQWTVPLSNLPQMKKIWSPVKRTLSQVILYQGDVHQALAEMYKALQVGDPAP